MMGRVRTRRGDLFYTDTEAGAPTVLLVHGWGGNSQEWCPLVARLAAAFRVIAVDLAGHGHSSPARAFPRDLAADLVDLLDQAGPQGVIAVGHSMGGQVVTALAVEHPGTVSGLVVIDPAYGAVGDEVEQLPERYAAVARHGWPAALEVLSGAFTAATPTRVRVFHEREMQVVTAEVLASAYAGMYLAPGAFGARPATERYLRRCAIPTLALLTSSDVAGWIGGHLHGAGSEVLTWPGSGHYLHEEQPEQVADVIANWLKNATGGIQ
jgi:pimeloyl-ACP methyl ester carboxylesterase